MSYCEVYTVKVSSLATEWYNKKDQLHRIDGPAVEWASGDKAWYLNGQRHRTDGPAVEWADGSKEWDLNDKLHRTDGPAVEWADGYKAWYLNGKRHRTDGPAIEWSDGSKEWYLNGKEITEEQFKRQTSKDPCDGKIVEIEGKKYKLSKV